MIGALLRFKIQNWILSYFVLLEGKLSHFPCWRENFNSHFLFIYWRCDKRIPTEFISVLFNCVFDLGQFYAKSCGPDLKCCFLSNLIGILKLLKCIRASMYTDSPRGVILVQKNAQILGASQEGFSDSK